MRNHPETLAHAVRFANRSSRRTWILLVGVAWISSACTAGPSPWPVPAENRIERWIQDLDYLVENLERLHAAPERVGEGSAFSARIAALRSRVPTLLDFELEAEVVRHVASIGDMHTLAAPESGFTFLPLRLRFFGDELFVIAAREELRSSLGRRIEKLGDVAVPTARVRADRYAASDNEGSSALAAGNWLSCREVLEAIGAVRRGEPLRMAFSEGDGVDVPASLEGPWVWPWRSPPLYLSGADRDSWLETIESPPAQYWRVHRCRSSAALKEQVAGLFRELDASGDARLIVDLRGNGGGDERAFAPLLRGLRKRPTLCQARRLAVVTDRGTASAAVDGTLELVHLGALHIGEDTGQRPNFLAQCRSFVLPNSRMKVTYPSRTPSNREPGDPEAVSPRIPVELGASDYLAGRDPVLEALDRRWSPAADALLWSGAGLPPQSSLSFGSSPSARRK